MNPFWSGFLKGYKKGVVIALVALGFMAWAAGCLLLWKVFIGLICL